MSPAVAAAEPGRAPQAPVRRPILNLALVLPADGVAIPGRAWASIACAMVLDHDGETRHARALLRRLEDRLGVNDAHRLAVETSPEEVRARIRASRSASFHTRRALRLAGADRLPAPTDDIERLIQSATQHEEKAAALRAKNPRAHRDAIRRHMTDAKTARADAARLREAQLEKHWADQAIRETTDYETARGGQVETVQVTRARFETDQNGVRVRHRRSAVPVSIKQPGHRRGDNVLIEEEVTVTRISTRGGGLALALKRGDLAEPGASAKRHLEHLTAAHKYRTLYEEAEAMRARGGGEPVGGSRAQGRNRDALYGQEAAADSSKALGYLRQGLTQRQIEVLDMVCGRDLSVNATALELEAGVPSVRRALREGLAIVAGRLAEARRAGRQSKARVL